jgi:hypothetical protein
MLNKLLNILEFYKSTVVVNYTISAIAYLFIDVAAFFAISITFGFILSLAIIEVKTKQYYLFYYNNGISKLQLWLGSFFINIIFSLVIVLVITAIKLLL